jgi:hypothetical protein
MENQVMNNRVARVSKQGIPPKKLDNILTYIVSKYGRRDGVRVPHTVGGTAFAGALLAKGIVTSV